MAPTVLIVEDELIAAENLKEFLEEGGYRVLEITDRGNRAVELAKKLRPDVVLMDIMLKDGLSGSEAALRIRNQCSTKIIFITAYALDEMLDYASQAEAEAYLIKPYNKEQIMTTMRFVLRKHGKELSSHRLALAGEYAFDTFDMQLYHNESMVRLGPKARALLALLCRHSGNSVSNVQICQHIWGGDIDGNVLRALVYRIRSTLGMELIENVRDAGYRIVLSSDLKTAIPSQPAVS